MRTTILVFLSLAMSAQATSQSGIHHRSLAASASSPVPGSTGIPVADWQSSSGRPGPAQHLTKSSAAVPIRLNPEDRANVTAGISRTSITDVQIGARDSVRKLTLTYDPGTGNLFSVLLFNGDSSVSGVAMYFSSDTGSTWLQTATIVSDYTIPDVSVCTAMGYFVVAGIYDSGKQVLLDRFFTSDGSPLDTTFEHPQMAFQSLGQERFLEVATSSNLNAFNNRFYCAALSDDRHVRFVTARDTGASNLFEYPSNEYSALLGLTTAFNLTQVDRSFAYLAFLDTSRVLCVDAIHDTTIGVGDITRRWRDAGHQAGSGAGGTSITALNDTVLVAYAPSINGVSQVLLSSIADTNDSVPWIQEFPGDTPLASDHPAVTMESGNGEGILYRYETSPAQLRFTSRGSRTASWQPAVTVSAIEPYPATEAIANINAKTYGFVNLSTNSPVVQGAYFSTNTLTSLGPSPVAPVAERFQLLQNFPNPFNPKTVVSGQWSVTSVVRLAVYDMLGREVAVLASGRYPAGKYEFTFDGSNLSSGVYFYRLVAGNYTAVRKMTLVK
ncbi:MAG TPA: T9SS type A sorting domain-containing protein [Bacteroidota bacterium]|nr:T9SS type A sorting domain-containing protein [Bacteroidota bacterium]